MKDMNNTFQLHKTGNNITQKYIFMYVHKTYEENGGEK